MSERIGTERPGVIVRPDDSVERAVSLVASRIVDPVLTDVRVRTDGGVRLSKVLPQERVDLFGGQDLVLLARYAGHGETRVIFEGKHQKLIQRAGIRQAIHDHFAVLSTTTDKLSTVQPKIAFLFFRAVTGVALRS